MADPDLKLGGQLVPDFSVRGMERAIREENAGEQGEGGSGVSGLHKCV